MLSHKSPLSQLCSELLLEVCDELGHHGVDLLVVEGLGLVLQNEVDGVALLVNIYHFDEAEALLQQLVKQPNNKRAVEELERLRKERKRKEDQDLNDMINGNIKPADDDMPM